MAKIITTNKVAELVQDGVTLGVQGIICTSVPEDLKNYPVEHMYTDAHTLGI